MYLINVPECFRKEREVSKSLVGCRVKLTKEVPAGVAPFSNRYFNYELNMYGTIMNEWPGENLYEILLDFDGFSRVRVGRDDFDIICNTRKSCNIKLVQKGPYRMPNIDKVIFNDPCTIVIWSDKTKTIVRKGEGEVYDPEKGMAMAICKKALGTNESLSNYYDIFKKYLRLYEDDRIRRVNE